MSFDHAAQDNHTASYFAMPAVEDQTEAFASFVVGATPIVKKTAMLTSLVLLQVL